MSRLEIERVWVLSRMPAIPTPAQRWRIEQGYIGAEGAERAFSEGRLRRVVHEDGSETLWHATKSGTGMVRQESERRLERAEFDCQWPRTVGARIHKLRHRVPEAGLVWEIDRFDGLPLAMAEVELPSEAHPVEIPGWLMGCLAMEVTTDPRWRNAALALHGVPAGFPGTAFL